MVELKALIKGEDAEGLRISLVKRWLLWHYPECTLEQDLFEDGYRDFQFVCTEGETQFTGYLHHDGRIEGLYAHL